MLINKSFKARRASFGLACALLLVPLLGDRGAAQQQQQQQQRPIKIVLLGTYHFGGTVDPVKVEGEDILAAGRQKEVDAVVAQLAAFRPQRIFVESRRPDLWRKVLQDYREGRRPAERWIAANEIFQFGIKLAHTLDLPEGVTPVDWQQPDYKDTSARLDTRAAEAYRELQKAVQENNFANGEWQSPTFKSLAPAHLAFMKEVPKLPLKEVLLRFNSERTRRFMFYSNILAFMDKDPRGVGAELSLTQQFRNMKIYQNILKNVDDRAERCLVIYGAGHIQALRDMFASNPRFEIVEVSDVLR